MKDNDLISRATAIDYLMTNMGWHDADGYEVDDADEKRAIITDLVNGIPAVDAAPVVHGRWKPITHGFPPEPRTVCSNCGLDIDYEICKRIKADSFSYTSIRSSYCPNCGAKMDGGEDDAGQ